MQFNIPLYHHNPFKNYGKIRLGRVVISNEAFGDLTGDDPQSLAFKGSLMPYLLSPTEPAHNHSVTTELIAISHHFDEISMGDPVPTYVATISTTYDEVKQMKFYNVTYTKK